MPVNLTGRSWTQLTHRIRLRAGTFQSERSATICSYCTSSPIAIAEQPALFERCLLPLLPR